LVAIISPIPTLIGILINVFAVAEKDLASLQYANLTVLQGSVTSVDVDTKVGRSSIQHNITQHNNNITQHSVAA
jgi:hypothetical protein